MEKQIELSGEEKAAIKQIVSQYRALNQEAAVVSEEIDKLQKEMNRLMGESEVLKEQEHRLYDSIAQRHDTPLREVIQHAANYAMTI